jgi:hypothetical protein
VASLAGAIVQPAAASCLQVCGDRRGGIASGSVHRGEVGSHGAQLLVFEVGSVVIKIDLTRVRREPPEKEIPDFGISLISSYAFAAASFGGGLPISSAT